MADKRNFIKIGTPFLQKFRYESLSKKQFEEIGIARKNNDSKQIC